MYAELHPFWSPVISIVVYGVLLVAVFTPVMITAIYMKTVIPPVMHILALALMFVGYQMTPALMSYPGAIVFGVGVVFFIESLFWTGVFMYLRRKDRFVD